MYKKFFYDGNCIESTTYYLNHKEEFGEIKSLTAFFIPENFLLTHYQLTKPSVTLILESYIGNIMEFGDANCGYRGTGPSSTRNLLNELGLPNSVSTILTEQGGIQISFSSDKQDYHISHDVFFRNVLCHNYMPGCLLNEFTFADVKNREVFFINPELNNFNGLLNCLEIMKPTELEFISNGNLGEYSKILSPLSMNILSQPMHNDGLNICVRGELFDIKCFVSNKLFVSTLNAIYVFLTKDTLMEEHLFGGVTLLIYQDKIKEQRKLFHFRKREIHKIISLKERSYYV